jgi:hypothetical protein
MSCVMFVERLPCQESNAHWLVRRTHSSREHVLATEWCGATPMSRELCALAPLVREHILATEHDLVDAHVKRAMRSA